MPFLGETRYICDRKIPSRGIFICIDHNIGAGHGMGHSTPSGSSVFVDFLRISPPPSLLECKLMNPGCTLKIENSIGVIDFVDVQSSENPTPYDA
jgi:hypothetical protein